MPKLLLVEDEPAIVRGLKRLLERAGFTVLVATNLEEARTHMEPDIRWVLCDTNLPDGEGSTLHREWSAAGLLRQIQFIAMSGSWAANHTAQHYYRDKGVMMVEKPFINFTEEVLSQLQ